MKLFEDFLPSYKGAGVIGTCVAVFVLVSLIGLSFFALDPSVGWGESGAVVSARQQREIGRLRADLEEEEGRRIVYRDSLVLRDEVQANLARSKAAEARGAELATSIEDTQGQLELLRAEHEAYAAAYRDQLRTKAVGEKLPAFDLPGGRHIEDPEVRKIDPVGIELKHRDGRGRVAFKDLPVEIQKRFQYDSAEAERFLAEEKEQADQHQAQVERKLTDSKETGRKEQIQRLEGKITSLTNEVAACAQEYAALRGNQRRNYNTLVALIHKVDQDERAIRRYQAELAELKAADKK